jgi:WD40 repeat protein
MLSTSLCGTLHYLDPKSGGILRTLQGHQKGITAMTYHAETKKLHTASFDGRVVHWTTSEPTKGAVLVQGSAPSEVHTTQIPCMDQCGRDRVFTIALDDTSRSIHCGTYVSADKVKLPSQPIAVVSLGGNSRLVATLEGLMHVTGDNKIETIAQMPKATMIAGSPKGTYIAVANERLVNLYKQDNGKVDWNTIVKSLEGSKTNVTCISFSPDESLVAIGDAGSKIFVFDVVTGEVKLNQWVFHTARVTSIAWSPDGQHAVSGSLDTSLIVWSVERPMKRVTIRNAHVESITKVAFSEKDEIVSVGADACVKTWKITTLP